MTQFKGSLVPISLAKFFSQMFIGLFVLGLSIGAHPVDSSQGVELPKKLHLITGNNFKPWSDESLINGGIVSEIVQEVFNQIGI